MAMRKKVPNFVILRPIRSLRDLPEKSRRYLLKQMENYLGNCEYEERRLLTFREKVNR